MSQHTQGVSRAVHARLFTLIAFLALAALAFAWSGHAVGQPLHEPAPQSPPQDPAATEASAATSASTLPEPLWRNPAEQPPPSPEPTFEDWIEQLVALAMHTSELAQDDEFEAAKASDQQARERFAGLLARFEDAGERGLAMLAGMMVPGLVGPAGDPLTADPVTADPVTADPVTADPVTADPVTADPLDQARRLVLHLVIAAECARRHTAALGAADYRRIDPLVQALLDVMPQAKPTADIGAHVLVDRPYLRAIHEAAVLGLVQMAGEGLFDRSIATRLLLTLWDNLQRTGERSSDELSRLAMLLLVDADPSKRTAACRQLIGDPRYRAMVLAWLREHADKAVAVEVAGIAARDLDPAGALLVLRELAPILQRAPHAYMVLGARAPDVLADAYRELLAANTQPGIRTDLIAGIGFATSAQSLEITQLALQSDPAPEVRIQAAFVMSASGGAGLGERAIQQLLDDPVIARDGNRLGALVLAMHNLEAAGDTNALDRLGQRLRAMPLPEQSRQSLEALLARSLPDGQVSGAHGSRDLGKRGPGGESAGGAPAR